MNAFERMTSIFFWTCVAVFTGVVVLVCGALWLLMTTPSLDVYPPFRHACVEGLAEVPIGTRYSADAMFGTSNLRRICFVPPHGERPDDLRRAFPDLPSPTRTDSWVVLVEDDGPRRTLVTMGPNSFGSIDGAPFSATTCFRGPVTRLDRVEPRTPRPNDQFWSVTEQGGPTSQPEPRVRVVDRACAF